MGESSGCFICYVLGCLGEVVRRVRLPGAAPVWFPPWPPDLQLERQGGYLSLLLVEWHSFAVLLLALSLRLLCLVKRSRHCERGSSRLLFSLVRSLVVYGPLTLSQRSL